MVADIMLGWRPAKVSIVDGHTARTDRQLIRQRVGIWIGSKNFKLIGIPRGNGCDWSGGEMRGSVQLSHKNRVKGKRQLGRIVECDDRSIGLLVWGEAIRRNKAG